MRVSEHSKWLAYGFGRTPATPYSDKGYLRIYAIFTRPFRYSFSNSVKCYSAVVAAVVGLRKVIPPSAILLAVMAVYVNPIHGMLNGWRKPHISQEVLKAFTPTSAKSNSSATIVPEIYIIGIAASTHQGHPRDETFSNQRITGVGHAMRLVGGFWTPTSTTSDLAVQKMINLYVLLDPALASTHPTRPVLCSGMKTNDRQEAKFSTNRRVAIA